MSVEDLLPTLSKELEDMVTLDVMLTTLDNPFNPFDQPEEWLEFDIDNGYDTNGMLALYSGDDNTAIDEVEKTNRIARAMAYIIDDGPIPGVWSTIRKGQPTPLIDYL